MRNISSIFLNLKAKEVQPVTIKVYLINCLMSVYTYRQYREVIISANDNYGQAFV